MRYIKLNDQDLHKLKELYRTHDDVTVRKRSHCLVLSSQGYNIINLAKIFSVSRRTIERWFYGWEKSGIGSLSIQPGRGVKTKLKGLETVISEQLNQHSRNLKNVLVYLEEEQNITICKKTLQNFLKDTGL